MVDSPLTSRYRLLTRSDSMRFIASRGTTSFAYGFAFASVLFMLLLILNPSSYQLTPRLRNAFHSSRRYHFSKVFGHIFTNSSFSPPPLYNPYSTNDNTTHKSSRTEMSSVNSSTVSSENRLGISPSSSQISRKEGSGLTPKGSNQKEGLRKDGVPPPAASIQPQQQKPSPTKMGSQNVTQGEHSHWRDNCDMYEGSWVRDDSYPLYRSGSCPHIDEPFNCFLNGRSDNMYEKFRWQPKNCNIPRLNGNDMLEILRGKRLVFVGDSLNRNMWESLVCILRNSVEDKNQVFEASGREEFRTEGSYSFIFTGYNCSVEFFRSPFLVQEWEIPDRKGSTKETLRLDLVERSCDKYKSADVLIFNTGHWWTHEKRMEGKEYYQEGNHIHGQLNVEEAFHKALMTWSQWVDSNIDPKKTSVFFRGYSPSHFGGGEWNSGGRCENETEPIKDEHNLSENPPMMRTIESVIKKMKTPIFYLNITKMTDFRLDAHPSMYRNTNMTEETKKYMLTHQDCSHWCLPGVPDLWNELVYAHLLSSMNRNMGKPQK
ncbi:protein trichome birefringence-like [Gastrolobium bilobum]|uniref:protein trichome birefringence-like n=1 Tax=Gastrolobium bilobum TaxID=150636 RepID=UPI002AB0F030|nr:protein trichome birefringence-like [Gastrolobium bilobum]XP_061357955.1 protein trichome birefringence-like [Gastrolobium bilobum]XP_061357956.1 protein trichome birefringence-like [Gastrolobium bilobum]